MKPFYWKMAMIVMVLSISMNAMGYDFEVNGIYYGYNTSDQSAYVTMGTEKYSGNIVIPESVTYNGRTMAVTAIGDNAFRECVNLLSVGIPKSVISIGDHSYANCRSMSSITIPNTVTALGYSAFEGCNFKTFVIEDGDDGLFTHTYAFSGCIANAIYIGRYINNDLPFYYSTSLVVIGKGVTDINVNCGYIDYTESVKSIYCKSAEPCSMTGSFNNSVYLNALLYVPIGSKEKYMAADGWKNFFNIQEMDVTDMWDGNGEPPGNDETKKKCEKPTIRYSNGKILFESATEGAICQSTITDSDITSYSGNEVQLGVTYHITVYATAAGYEKSDEVTATLCWIDVEPKTEGIENSVSQVRAKAILIQTNNGTLNVSGVDNGTDIAVYSSSGMMVGSANVSGESTSIATSLKNGEIAIVKIGDRAIKVMMK